MNKSVWNDQRKQILIILLSKYYVGVCEKFTWLIWLIQVLAHYLSLLIRGKLQFSHNWKIKRFKTSVRVKLLIAGPVYSNTIAVLS